MTRPDAPLGGMGPFLFAAAAMFAVMYCTQAILPELGRDFGVSPSQAGLTVSLVIAALALGAWFWGPLSDRIGRRASLILASGAVVVPTLLLALAPSFGVLLALRAVQGLCMPGLLTVGVPYVTEAYSAALGSRAMGYYVAALVAGGLVGRVGVALLSAAAGWRFALGALTLLPLASTLVMRRRLPPEPAAAARPGGFSAARALRTLRNPTLLAATTAGGGLFFAFMGTFSYVGFRLEAAPFFLSPTATGFVFLLWCVGVAGPAAGRLADRRTWRFVAVGGPGLAALGICLSLVDVLPVALAGLALVTLGNFSGVTAAQLGVASATDTDRGLASALYFSAYYVAGSLGGYLPGVAWEHWAWPGVAAAGLTAYGAGAVAVAVASRSGATRSSAASAAGAN